MSILTSLAIITLAALVHASFQLSVSVLTLLSAHAAGKQHSTAKQLRLTAGFVAGAGVMTLLLLSFIALVFQHSFGGNASEVVWASICGVLVGIGAGVWLFYYRYKAAGTVLWVPRSFARHLSNRSKETTHSVEAFSLGLTSVISELLFVIAPLAISALVILQLPGAWQLLGIGVYTVISLITLLSIWALVGSGKPLSAIQKWREHNKHFFQFASGSALVILGFFVYVYKVVSDAAAGGL